ncbi:MAG: hypothetical protein K8S27_13980 [Candidatus Omnitrophica bacterium]|nr:hypothetical protein [Candidatus Omnitrophota bacterium]
MTRNQSKKILTTWCLIFLCCFFYWGYLFFASSFDIAHDAVGYQNLGKMVHQKGWKEYFITGPNREPVYIATIALSMKLGEMFSLNYQYFQKLTQVLCLFISQLMVLVLLRRLQIRRGVQMLVIFYMGFSPALVNAAFSLYSEIAALPFVPLLLVCCLMSFQRIFSSENKNPVSFGIYTAFVFMAATLCKGIFHYVFLTLAGILGMAVLFALYKKRKSLLVSIILFLCPLVMIYSLGIGGFMALNKHYNGHFEITNRYAGALFGVAYKRTNPVTSRIVMSHVAAIPGWGVCRMFFTEEECRYTEFYASDMYYMGPTLTNQLKDLPEEEHYTATIQFAFDRIKQHPFRYTMFCLIEAPKMFFWESTRIGFVNYPQWLHQLFVFKPVRLGVRLLMSLLTMIALGYLLLLSIKRRSMLVGPTQGLNMDQQRLQTSLMILLIVFFFTGLYSLFLILTRYALPVAPLYLIAIAIFVDEMCPKPKRIV